MNLIILSPGKEVFNGQVKSVKVPGTTGQFEILNDHAPIVSALSEGIVRILEKDGKKTEFLAGFVRVVGFRRRRRRPSQRRGLHHRTDPVCA